MTLLNKEGLRIIKLKRQMENARAKSCTKETSKFKNISSKTHKANRDVA